MTTKTVLCLLLCLSCALAGWSEPGGELSEEERIRLKLPSAEPCAPEAMIHTNEEDRAYVASLPAEVFTAVDEYVKVRRNKDFQSQGNVRAARLIGTFILLWVSEPDVFDGGFELIYSIEKRRIVGSFFAGYKG